jgi:hypothetical protein
MPELAQLDQDRVAAFVDPVGAKQGSSHLRLLRIYKPWEDA